MRVSFPRPGPLLVKLPATSANLGPGFDSLALALGLYLEMEARASNRFRIDATGRNPEVCSQLEGNLLLAVYADTIRAATGSEALPIALTMHNGIPVGMGCGSSAASRLAGVALASHFGELGWSQDRILAEACRLEGHPDNAAACWLGGFVAAGPGSFATPAQPAEAPPVAALSILPPTAWRALLVLPHAPLATTVSRAVLPAQVSRADAVANLQRVALLTAAFAASRGDLLAVATDDRLHQPYRGQVCPLLPRLLPLAGSAGILSVTLSGAGPAVLLLLEDEASAPGAEELVRQRLAKLEPEGAAVEMLLCTLSAEAALVKSM